LHDPPNSLPPFLEALQISVQTCPPTPTTTTTHTHPDPFSATQPRQRHLQAPPPSFPSPRAARLPCAVGAPPRRAAPPSRQPAEAPRASPCGGRRRRSPVSRGTLSGTSPE
jgi:hypothetical protein